MVSVLWLIPAGPDKIKAPPQDIEGCWPVTFQASKSWWCLLARASLWGCKAAKLLNPACPGR